MSIETRALMDFAVDVGSPVTIDAGAHGRRYIPILGGKVSGKYVGQVVPGGADWQVIWPDGRLELEARYALEIDGHGAVEVTSLGVRHGPPDVLAALARGDAVDPAAYYFRTSMRFRTAVTQLSHLNGMIALARGQRDKSVVRLSVFEVL